jgi:hypothetical protein
MKTALRLVTIVLILASFDRRSGLFAQGTIIFNNRNLTDPTTGASYHAPVTLPNGGGAEGGAFTAGLFLVHPGALELLKSTPFREGAAAGYIVPDVVIVPGIQSGSPATFRVRVWETAAGSFEAAMNLGRLHGEFRTQNGDNDIFIDRLGSQFAQSVDTPDLSGIQPLTLVPEPSPLALGALAAFLMATTLRRSAGTRQD